MTAVGLTASIENLVRQSAGPWLLSVSSILRACPPEISADALMPRLPKTTNNDMAFTLVGILRRARPAMSWEALGWSIEACASAYEIWRARQKTELLWTGPAPDGRIPARRIDQVFYDLLAIAEREALLVTFAAYKVKRLNDALSAALDRGVRIRLVLEFDAESQGQLSVDALNAFPLDVRDRCEIYFWPSELRPKNDAGKSGKLHAKVAVVDGSAIISSANLTDDAFSRNLEIGALFSGGEIVEKLAGYFHKLITTEVLLRWRP